MSQAKRVLITGHQGYIGSVMVPFFLKAGYDVVGLDTGYFLPCTLVPDAVTVPCLSKDIRGLEPEDLRGFEAVVHLAALSNDPIGNLNGGWTEEINHSATLRLAELARASGTRRFLFSSSCIMYGMSEAAVVDETSPLDPKTEYARSKVKSERGLSELADERFSPTFLRNGTIYGLSPRMRFDTVLNNLVGSAAAEGVVRVLSDGLPWRPVVHVEDVAGAFLKILEAPSDRIHNQAFNVGAEHLNHRILELAEIVDEAVEGSRLEVLSQPGSDQRTYKADFTKFSKTFPDFEFRWSARTGSRRLAESLRELNFTGKDFHDPRFTRLRWLNHLLESRQLDGSLYWTNGRPGGSRD